MGEVKQINIKNRTYYFYNDMINLKNFEPNLLKIDRKSYKNIGIYNIGYITSKKIDDCEDIYSVNPLYLLVNHAGEYVEEKKWKWILNLWLYRWKQRVTIKYNDAWCRIKNKIEKVGSGKYDYEKDFIKIKFYSDDELPLNKPLKFHMMTIIIRSVFEEDGKHYPQVFLDDTLDELSV